MSIFGIISWLPLLLVLLAGVGLGALMQRRRKSDAEQIIELYDKQLDEARLAIDERDAQLVTRSTELRALETEIEGTRRSLTSADTLANQLRLSLADAQLLPRQIQERESQLEQVHSDMDNMRSDYASELADLRLRMGDADALRTQIARYQQQLQMLDARLARVQRDKDQAIAELATRVAELEPLAQSQTLQAANRIEAAPSPAAAPALDSAPALDTAPAADGELAEQGGNAEATEPIAAGAGRMRELERDLSRLRQRILQLESLHLVIQDRDEQIRELRQHLTEGSTST